ncbi:MAG: AlwI family type II restriction endonuclease [Oscillospiraceae bacterium]|nr:AlwI family type II restriction endonuclease [Oscillospiraceae bacterium]
MDIGLISNERRLTNAGRVLLQIANSGDFRRDNLLNLPTDSYLYLKQLLKTATYVDNGCVRPFVITIYAISRLGYLTDEEFTYLLPLCTTNGNTKAILGAIEDLRNNEGNVNSIITSRLMAMDNYKAALEHFLNERVTENVIVDVGMNRKSRSYDKPYFELYKLLYKIVFLRDTHSVLPLFEQSRNISGKSGTLWRQFLFNTTSRRKIEQSMLDTLNNVPLLNAQTEHEFKQLFFEQMHLFKARANLSDFADLNRRYFKTTDTLIFADNKVELDVLPRCWLSSIVNKLPSIAFSVADNLINDVELLDIAPFLKIDESILFANLQEIYGVTVRTATDASRLIYDERYRRFNKLIDEKFNRETLIDLFAMFERRDDDSIRQIVTNNALVPTIFEYVLGIAWYLISNRQGDVLSYMNLSLEADLLPRSHAIGGSADIAYLYEKTEHYPAHCLLIEATLSDGNTQRRMEMEPVSRHLGEYILRTKDENAYALFVSTFLRRNVISDFRNRRTYQYYSDSYENCVDGLKILPIATTEIRKILENDICYERLYDLFDTAYSSDEPVPTWYEREVVRQL